MYGFQRKKKDPSTTAAKTFSHEGTTAALHRLAHFTEVPSQCSRSFVSPTLFKGTGQLDSFNGALF